MPALTLVFVLIGKTQISPGFETERKYDLVFDFVDNLYTRALNTAFAMSQEIPLISAGALPYSARWYVQVAGESTCQDCLFLYQLLFLYL